MLYEYLLVFTTRNFAVMAKPKKSVVAPRKMPAQDRSRAMVEVILDAAARATCGDVHDTSFLEQLAMGAGADEDNAAAVSADRVIAYDVPLHVFVVDNG